MTILQKINNTDWLYPPAKCKISYNDVSDKDAGRTENGEMQKMKLGTCVKIECEWKNCPTAIGQAVTSTFSAEYFNVTYYDVATGVARTAQFYAGDRGCAVYNSNLEIWESITVNLIERKPV